MTAAHPLFSDVPALAPIFGGAIIVGGLFLVVAVVWFGLWLARRVRGPDELPPADDGVWPPKEK